MFGLRLVYFERCTLGVLSQCAPGAHPPARLPRSRAAGPRPRRAGCSVGGAARRAARCCWACGAQRGQSVELEAAVVLRLALAP